MAKEAAKEKQLARFLEAARKLETDDDKERFEAKLGKVARVPVKAIRDDGAPATRKAKPSKAKARR